MVAPKMLPLKFAKSAEHLRDAPKPTADTIAPDSSAEAASAVRVMTVAPSVNLATAAVQTSKPSPSRSKEDLTDSERANRNRALLFAKRDEAEAAIEAEIQEEKRKA